MRKWLLILLMLIVALPITAQETPEPGRGWRAWLYDSNSGDVTVVDQNGETVREFTLPLPQAFNFYGQNIAVSPSGTHVLYTALDTSASIPNQQVFVYDINAGFIAISYPLNAGAQATTLDVRPTPVMFDEASRRVAFGYVISSEEMTGWEVVLLDYNSGLAETTLNSETDAAELLLPVIRNFDGTTVAYTAVYYGTGAAAYPSYLWDTSTDTVTETQIYSSIQADRDPETGEVIAPAYMEAMSAAPLPEQPGFTIPQNVATVYQPQSGTRHVFYNDAERVIDNMRFVQDGERVAISRYDAQTDTPGTWQIIERDGTVLGNIEIPSSVFNVFGTPDGLVYLDLGQEGPALVHIRTVEDSLTQEVIWTGEIGTFPVLAEVQADVIISAESAEGPAEWVELTDPEPIE